jgi:hypothetical protein
MFDRDFKGKGGGLREAVCQAVLRFWTHLFHLF